MYDFILQFLIMASLAVIIYLVARTIPRIDENIASMPSKSFFFDRLISKERLEKLDFMFNNLLEKLLRKFKIVVMKLDNVLTKWLSSFKPGVSSEKDVRPNIFSSQGGSASGGNNSDSVNINNRSEDRKE